MNEIYHLEKPVDVLKWDAAQVEAHLIEAMWTMTRLPDPSASWQHVKAGWGEVIHDYAHNDAEAVARKSLPTKEQHERWEGILNWVRDYITLPEDRTLIGCACLSRMGAVRFWVDKATGREPSTKFNWEVIKVIIAQETSGYERRSVRVLRRHYRKGLEIIAAKLNAKDM